MIRVKLVAWHLRRRAKERTNPVADQFHLFGYDSFATDEERDPVGSKSFCGKYIGAEDDDILMGNSEGMAAAIVVWNITCGTCRKSLEAGTSDVGYSFGS